jgi:predicted RNA-binding Zn ribbon-like protein
LTNRRAVDRWALASGRAVRLGRDARLGEAIRIREAIDGFFRHAALGGVPDAALWRRLVALYLRHGASWRPVVPSDRPPDLYSALLLAALEIAFSPLMRRIKVCPSCGWLFIDRTRNGRKRWCIPSLCGNRARARRFYARRTARRAGSDLTEAVR